MRLHRLLGIIMLLDSRGIMKASSLAKILETSERSIYRDIDVLCESGIPILSIPGPTGGYSLMEGYKTNTNSLESGDIFNLLLSNMGLKPEGNSDSAQQLKNALIKLENSISEEHRNEIQAAKERFFIDTDPWWGKRVQNKYIEILKKSVLDLKKIKIEYKKHNGEASDRIVHPFGVVVKNSEWYLVGLCELKRDIRVFKCSRIGKLEVLEDSFEVPEAFRLEEFWRSSSEQFRGNPLPKHTQNSYPVTLKLSEEKNKMLDGFHIYSIKKEGEAWIYDFDMISFKTAYSVIFPLSDKLEVLYPSELREYIIEKINKINILYGINSCHNVGKDTLL